MPELFPEGFAQGYLLKDLRPSRKLGLCLRRVRLLEEGGLIAGYVMVLDPTAAGLPGVNPA